MTFLNKIKEVGKNKLILMALGPISTVLDYDLSNADLEKYEKQIITKIGVG